MSEEGNATTYFGLWSRAEVVRAQKLLADLGVRCETSEYQTTRELLEEWDAWDGDAVDPQMGVDLWIWTDDLQKLGTRLVEAFPKRKFGA